MGKTAIILMIITLISKVTGLVREQFFAYYLGTGPKIDIYNTATTIPSILFAFIVAGVVAGFIPVYSRVEHKEGAKKARKFTSNLINALSLITIIVVITIIIFAPILVSMFAPGYTGEKRELTIQFTRIMSMSLFSAMISSVFIGYLQLHNRFVVAETAGILMNFFNVAFLVLSFYFNNFFILAFGYVASEYLKYMFFPHFVRKEGYKHSFKIDWHDPYLKQMLHIAIPIFISIAAVDVSTIFDQSLASVMRNNGGVSSMRFASLILTLVSGIIVVSISTSIYPKLSKLANNNDSNGFKKTLIDGNLHSFILIIPAMFGVMILAEPLIRLLFQRGAFNHESTMVTSRVLQFYMPTILGYSVGHLFTRAFYAQQNTRTPILVTFTQVITNIILNYVLSFDWGFGLGLNGLALATSISSFISIFANIFLFRKKYGRLNLKRLFISTLKIFIASMIMGLVTYFVYHTLALKTHYLIAFGASFIASVITYGIVIIFMGIPEVKKMVNLIYHKVRKK